MKHIILTECYDKLRITDEEAPKAINQSQADEFADFIVKQRLKTEYINWGNNSITFINYVGYIQCSTFSIEILPKVAMHDDPMQMRKVLLEMLKECGYINVTTSKLSQLQLMEGSLLEIFGRIYADSLFLELKKGVTTKYHEVENNLMTLKGSLIIPKHIQENLSRNKKYMAYCEYDERIIDHVLNQVFKAANHLILTKVRNIETQKLLKQIVHYLDDVSLKTFSPKQLDQLKLDRTNKRFEIPLLLAKQFLMNKTASFSTNDQTSFSLLFEMNDLFEKYIAVLVKKATNHSVIEQDNKHRLLVKETNNREIFQLKPDIFIDNGFGQIIIDTKWKTLTTGNRSGVKREDLYQMYAYLTRYERVKTAILLYPQPMNLDLNYDEQLESWFLHADNNKKLKIYAVSLLDKVQTVNEIREIIKNNGLD